MSSVHITSAFYLVTTVMICLMIQISTLGMMSCMVGQTATAAKTQTVSKSLTEISPQTKYTPFLDN